MLIAAHFVSVLVFLGTFFCESNAIIVFSNMLLGMKELVLITDRVRTATFIKKQTINSTIQLMNAFEHQNRMFVENKCPMLKRIKLSLTII